MRLFILLIILWLPMHTIGQHQLRRINTNNTIDSFKIDEVSGAYNWNGDYYFIGFDSVNGTELYLLQNHTTPVAITDMSGPKQKIKGVGYITSIGNNLYFSGYGRYNSTGVELWEYDGVNPPTLAVDINPGNGNGFPSGFLVHNGKIYFMGCFTGEDHTFGVFDPVSKTATQLLPPVPQHTLPIVPFGLTVYNNKIYFSGRHPMYGRELYEYDPATSTAKIYDLYPLDKPWGNSSDPTHFTVLNNKLYFAALDTIYPLQNSIFEFDGVNKPKALGIHMITGITTFNNNLYVTKHQQGFGYELHKFNTQNNTTTLIHDINKNGDSYPAGYYTHNGKMYFRAFDEIHNGELWSYNEIDTPVLVKDIIPGNLSSMPNGFITSDSFLYFWIMRHTPLDTTSYNSIKATTYENSIIIYPNPTNDIAHLQINLKESKTLNIIVTDINGRKVYKTENVLYSASQHTVDIPMHNLPAGSYIYRVNDNTNTLMVSGKIAKL